MIDGTESDGKNLKGDATMKWEYKSITYKDSASFCGTATAEAAGTLDATAGGASSSRMSPRTMFPATAPVRCARPEPTGS